MTEADRLESALREFHRLHQLMIKTPLRKDENWKRDFVAMRRQLQALLTQLAGLSDQIAKAVPQAGVSVRYRECLSQMRHRVALHQADWPVVQIDADDPSYRASNEGVRAASQSFLAAADRVLKALRGHNASQT